MKILNRILLFLKPVQMFMQRLGRKETIMTMSQVQAILALYKPGDIILSYEAQRFTSLFIRGNFDHASILTPNNSVMEAVGDNFVNKVNLGGVREVELLEWLFKKDHVCLIRPSYENNLVNKIAAANSFFFKGLGYDYGFRINGDVIYCSELVYQCYAMEDPEFMGHVDENRQILPIEYLEMCKIYPSKFSVVYNTRQ